MPTITLLPVTFRASSPAPRRREEGDPRWLTKATDVRLIRGCISCSGSPAGRAGAARRPRRKSPQRRGRLRLLRARQRGRGGGVARGSVPRRRGPPAYPARFRHHPTSRDPGNPRRLLSSLRGGGVVTWPPGALFCVSARARRHYRHCRVYFDAIVSLCALVTLPAARARPACVRSRLRPPQPSPRLAVPASDRAPTRLRARRHVAGVHRHHHLRLNTGRDMPMVGLGTWQPRGGRRGRRRRAPEPHARTARRRTNEFEVGTRCTRRSSGAIAPRGRLRHVQTVERSAQAGGCPRGSAPDPGGPASRVPRHVPHPLARGVEARDAMQDDPDASLAEVGKPSSARWTRARARHRREQLLRAPARGAIRVARSNPR